MCNHAPKLRRKLVRVYGEMQQRFAETLRAAVAARELPRDTDVDAKAEALVALTQGSMLLSAVHDDPATSARLASLALALVRA
jgi:hypothetical protein